MLREADLVWFLHVQEQTGQELNAALRSGWHCAARSGCPGPNAMGANDSDFVRANAVLLHFLSDQNVHKQPVTCGKKQRLEWL